jgi:hypothetical protein
LNYYFEEIQALRMNLSEAIAQNEVSNEVENKIYFPAKSVSF